MKLPVLGTLLLLTFFVYSQDVTSPIDSSKHTPRKAALFSAILPGAGQIYNQVHTTTGKKNAYWKVPLIYAGLAGTGFWMLSNQLEVNKLKTEYRNRINNSGSLDPKWSIYDNEGVLLLYQQQATKRDLSILSVGAVYLFQLADAAVEGHFVHFDISPDLSLGISPVLISNTTAVSFQLNFR